ncbi:MAG: DNA polymerase Y family protein [Bacteroidetes bacterium]|nr:MAG: DNA polymerase Y family protein [Bacteroidota bacterium]
MSKRFVVIWFPYLRTDWFTRRKQILKELPFVLTVPDHGRQLISASNPIAREQGVETGMVLADARAVIPSLQVLDDRPEISHRLLKGLAEWCTKYTPFVAIDLHGGLILDASGCTHLWGGEIRYLEDILTRFKNLGYHTRAAIADTIGTAWAMAHYGKGPLIIESKQQTAALMSLPAEALRIEAETVEQLYNLGLGRISGFIGMQRSALRRRFGRSILQRLDQALGNEEEIVEPVQPVIPYQERLPSLEPIITATGIEIGLQRLLGTLCHRLKQEQKGLKTAIFKCYRTDGRIEKIEIGTNHPSSNSTHLFKLFELKISCIEPGPGIDLFLLEAQKTETVSPLQEKIWQKTGGLNNIQLSELFDRIAGKFGNDHIQRYVPDEHYWPERSIKPALSVNEELLREWKTGRPRPVQLLSSPEQVQVTAPVPDYPPMNFRYKGKLHKIIKADGPERIEQEWWLQQGQHRDYYYVEDEEGRRYWLFRAGHYSDSSYQWFIHGFFA